MKLIITTAFGLESVTARELTRLGYLDFITENGRILIDGSAGDVANLNLNLRTAGRVLIEVGTFAATTFDELFEGVKSIAWGDFLEREAAFIIAARNVRSQLMSVPDTQSLTKKAIAVKLAEKYKIETLPETGYKYKIETWIVKDLVSVTLDTSGDGLHKRGYRKNSGNSPLRETMAAALVQLSVWNKERLLVDPFCGSGTILIEACLDALKIAPGLNRNFDFEHFGFMSTDINARRAEAKQKAQKNINENRFTLQGYDIDARVLATARANAKTAGVGDFIDFHMRDFTDFSTNRKYGVVVTNPPYGVRMGQIEEAEALVKKMGETFRDMSDWSCYILSSLNGVEKLYGKKATKRRKLFNGNIQTGYYQFVGERPPKGEK